MKHICHGSPAGSLCTILSTVGEYPYSSLHLLGNERYFRNTVHQLLEKNTLHHTQSGEKHICKLFMLSGKSSLKTIRLCKDALPILNWISPDALGYYLNVFRNCHFHGDRNHIERNHRIAEAVAIAPA